MDVNYPLETAKSHLTQKEEEIESEILNMEEIHWKILSLMGKKYENIYL